MSYFYDEMATNMLWTVAGGAFYQIAERKEYSVDTLPLAIGFIAGGIVRSNYFYGRNKTNRREIKGTIIPLAAAVGITALFSSKSTIKVNTAIIGLSFLISQLGKYVLNIQISKRTSNSCSHPVTLCEKIGDLMYD